VFDSVSHVLLENVYFERNGTNGTKAAEGDADGTCPIGAGIEVRQTIGQVDVVHHTYLRPFFGYQADHNSPPAFRINTNTEACYGCGDFREFAIIDPWSPHVTWDLKHLHRSLIIASHTFSYDPASSSWENLILRYGSNLGAGMGIFGNWYTEVRTLAVNDPKPDVHAAQIWVTANTKPLDYTLLQDAGVSGKQLTIIVNDTYSHFKHGQGNLHLSNGQDWDRPQVGDTIQFVYVAQVDGGQWFETSRSVK
jgi:hypothetical protein